MRFQQLKRDPNIILKKKLVKSGKNWAVMSSLILASGLFLMNSSTVKADTVSDSQATVVQSNTPSTQGDQENSDSNPTTQSTVNDSTPKSTVQSSTTNPNTSTTADQPNDANPVASAPASITPQVETAPVTSDNSTSQPEEQSPQSTTTSPTEDNFQIPKDALASGQGALYGTSKWYISNGDNTLHIGPGTLIGQEDYQRKSGSAWSAFSDKINAISFDGNIQAVNDDREYPNGISYFFANMPNLTQISNLERLHFGKNIRIDYLFANDPKLTDIGFSKLDVSNVISVQGIFSNDPGLKSLDLSTWNTSNIDTYTDMFLNDTGLTSLDLHNFDTKNAHFFDGMFNGTSNITSLDISNFDTGNATFMEQMFQGMSKMDHFNLPKTFVTDKVVAMYYMFADDSALQNIDISNFDTSNALEDDNEIGIQMFSGTKNLKTITLGPKNNFKLKYPNDGYSPFVLPSDKKYWVNIGNGTAENPQANLYFNAFDVDTQKDSDKVADSLYDGSGKVGVETFVPVDSFAGEPTPVNPVEPAKEYTHLVENIYLNGKPYSKLGSYKFDSEVADDGTIDSKQIKSPTIDPKWNWKIDEANSNLVLTYSDASKSPIIVDYKTIIGALQDKPLTLNNTLSLLGNNYKNYLNDTISLNLYYTGKDPIPTPSSNQHHSHSSGSITPSVPTINVVKRQQDIATYDDEPDVLLHAIDDNNISTLENRGLAHGTDWFSDEMATVDGQEYYRVATNEWVKSNQAYPYWPIDNVIKTNQNSNELLYSAKGVLVSNRALAPNTSWFTDQYIYINNEKYYRVATNEFVKATDFELEN